MSGLRETIRRRGGLALTSRVVGGLWVVGQRTVPSPYNAAATAALKAQFPNDWVAIRTFGFENLQYVPYINQYPMIAGSMVELSNGQKVVMTTENAVTFITDIVPNNTTDELYLSFKLLNANQEIDSILGYETIWSNNKNSFDCGPTSANGTFWYHNAGGFKNTGSQRSSKVGQWLTQFLTTSRYGLLGVEEGTLGNGSVNWDDNSKTVKLGIGTQMAFTEAKMKRNGSNLMRLVPAANNVVFDAERLIVIQNTGTGSSTISIIS